MFYLMIISFMLEAALSIRVLESTVKLGTMDVVSGASIKEPHGLVETEDLTVCIRFNLKSLSGVDGRVDPITISDFISDPRVLTQAYALAWQTNSLAWLKVTKDDSFLTFGHPKAEGSFGSFLLLSEDEHGEKELFAANRWMHLCFSYQKKNGLLTVVRNGEVIAENEGHPDLSGVVILPNLLSMIYIGRCAVPFKSACSSPEAEYTDLNIWGEYFSSDRMIEWTTCQKMQKGTILNWDEAEFNLVNMVAKDVSDKKVCRPVIPGNTIFPTKQTLQELKSLCLKLNSKISVVNSKTMEVELHDQLLPHADSCSTTAGSLFYWNGWWDQLSEGTFTDVNDNHTLPIEGYHPWQLSEPNGRSRENCAVTISPRLTWNDIKCEQAFCGFCQLNTAPVFTLRGLCDESEFDMKYSWTRNIEKNHYILRGYSNSLIKYIGNDEWQLIIYNNNVTYGTVKSVDYPLGKRKWTIHNSKCFDQQTTETVLSLNACNDSEFNCDDGQCIPMKSRCDSKIDCNDKTDEVGCNVYEKDKSYIKNMPPDTKAINSATTVQLELDILTILEIAEVDSYLSMQIEIHLTWSDSRLTMVDMNDEATLNFLPLQSRNEIWIPDVVFYNTEIKSETLNDEKAFAYVTKSGNYKRQKYNHLQNSYIYEGQQNHITLSRVYSDKFICDYDMSIYPFDKQECFVIFTMKGKFDKFVKLFGKNASYLGPKDLPQYYVIGAKISNVIVPPNQNAVRVDISFGRRILSTILSSYLPTFLICILTLCTSHFKDYYFEAAVTVNLTSMLTLTTLFVSVFDSLPQTSYIKMIDIWLIFCLTIPFLQVIVQTYQEYVRDNRHDGNGLLVNRHGFLNLISGTNSGGAHGESDSIGTDPNRMFVPRKEKETVLNNTTWNERVVKYVTTWGLPVYFFAFTIIYFLVGFAMK